MYAIARIGLLCALALSLLAAVPAVAQELRRRAEALPASDGNWPRFRGPDGSGSSNTSVPLEWSATRNIVWKADLPGRGASSPVVWDDRVYVTAYTGYGLADRDPPENLSKLQRHLLCISRRDGRPLWQADVAVENNPEHPITAFMSLHGYATSTPAADASGVYVYFGTCGLIAYGHDGREKWRKQLGERNYTWGTASSPILFKNLVIVHADIEAKALVALDKATGREVWRVETGEQDSWSTPLVVAVGDGHELVYHQAQGEPATLAAVDPNDGSPLWQCRVLNNYLCPSPIADGGIVYVLAYQRGAAVRAGGRGDVSRSHVEWSIKRGTEIPSPLYHDGHIYWAHQEDGTALCVDAATGELVYQERLQPAPGKMYASGVLAGGRIYYTSRERGTYVIAAKPEFELLAHNQIEGDKSIFNGTPALSREQIFLRSDKCLYCVGER